MGDLVFDASVRAIVLRTILISGAATTLAVLVGVPVGYAIARRNFRGRTILLGFINTGMGMPPVVVGLVVWVLLVRSGPFGDLDLIYTRQAMVLAQFLIATPIVVGFTTASIQALSPRLPDLLAVLGAGRVRTLWILATEAKLGLLVAVMAAFLRRSVRDNLELGLQLRGVDRAEMQVRVEHAVTLLGIAHLTERRADHLSGGEARRVSIARALCLRAPIVLLDEPLAGLDERTYSRMVDELPHILAAFGTTTVLVTHKRDEALRLAQNLVVLVGGRVLAAGDPREVAMSPGGVEVAEVLGYSVLTVNGRQVAVPRGALRIGPGHPEFVMMVEDALDLIDSRFVVGRIGDVRVHVPLSGAAQMPVPGDRVLVHGERVSELN